ncbi:MAG: hypothetical protein ACRYGA_11310 [Janthinobacterium lividum]
MLAFVHVRDTETTSVLAFARSKAPASAWKTLRAPMVEVRAAAERVGPAGELRDPPRSASATRRPPRS